MGAIMPRDRPCALAPQGDPLHGFIVWSRVRIRFTHAALVRLRPQVPPLLP